MKVNNKFPITLNKESSDWKLRYCKNINSIYCVVGENGAGKTRLLNSILKQDKKFIDLPNNSETKGYSIVKYSTSMELVDLKRDSSKYLDISTSYFLSMMNLVRLNREDSINQVKVVLDFYDNKNIVDKKWQKLIELSNKKLSFKLTESGEAIKKYNKSYFSGQISEKYLKNFLSNFKKEIKSENKCKVLREMEEILIIKFLAIFTSEIISLADKTDFNDNSESDILELFNKLKDKIFNRKTDYESELKSFLENDSKKSVKGKMIALENFFKNFNDFRNKLKESYLISNIDDIEALKTIINMICNNEKDGWITKEVFSVLEIEWNGLSSGELALLNLLGRLNSITNQLKDNVLLLIDEVDLGMHPEWQRKWVKDVLPIIGKILHKKNRSVHVILTTHSPIILSDFMKEDVIYLSNKGNKDIEAIELDYNTFGQNIYSLFKNSFFLEDSKGGFADKFIEDLLNVFVDSSKPINDQKKFKVFCKTYKIDCENPVAIKSIFENIANMIGEDLIRHHIKIIMKKTKWINEGNSK